MEYKKRKKISLKLVEKENLRFFRYVFNAVLNVHIDFVTYKVPIKKDKDKEHVERVFAYEFYRQWFNLLRRNKVKNLVINAEPSKNIIKEIYYNDNGNKKGIQTVYPDLVLHSSQSSDNSQKMICEIKREGNGHPSAIAADLLKLICYTNNDFYKYRRFEYGIFILYGKSITLDSIKIEEEAVVIKWHDAGGHEEKFSEYIKEKDLSRIVCIAYDGNGTSLEYDTLDNIINKQN